MTEPSREIQRFNSVWKRSPRRNSVSSADERSSDRKCSLSSRRARNTLDDCLQVPLTAKFEMNWTCEKDIARALIDLQKEALQKETQTSSVNCEKKFLHCPVCRCFYVFPVTLSCGHTLCKTCIWLGNGDQNSQIDCRQCGVRNVTNRLSVNVLITRLIQKLFPGEYEREVRKLENIQRERVPGTERAKLVASLTDILEISPDNFKALKWRSRAYFEMEKYQQALEDANQACVLRPFLPSVFYLRGLILVAIDSYERAAFSFARCVALDASSLGLPQLLTCLTKILSCESPYHETFWEQFATLNSVQMTTNRCKLSLERLFNDSVGNADKSEKRKRKRSNVDEAIGSSADSVEKKSGGKRSFQEAEASENKWDEQPPRSKFRKLSRYENQLITKEDLECKICYSILYQAITTDCGHTFCRDCLKRSLDFRPECPYCRQSLDCRVISHTAITFEVKEAVEDMFHEEYTEREQSFTDEEANWKRVGVDESTEVPVFVCMLAFPSLKYPLHIFETRYRLMIRKSYELGTRMFGMCTTDEEMGFSEYGTMLFIDNMELLPDGRSIVQTTATRRFQVMSRSMRDGYNTAMVRWLEDEAVPKPLNVEVRHLDILRVDCRKHLDLWFSGLTELQQECVTNAIGPIPNDPEKLEYSSNGPSWLWWALAAIPLQDRAKLIILSMTSLEERLRSLRRFLALLVSNR